MRSMVHVSCKLAYTAYHKTEITFMMTSSSIYPNMDTGYHVLGDMAQLSLVAHINRLQVYPLGPSTAYVLSAQREVQLLV